MIADFGFALIAGSVLLSALYVVRSTNLVHAVMWLGVTLAGTAVLYALLDAPFLAGVQVLLYVGGVVTLMIFGVMLTRRHDGLTVPADRGSPGRGALVAAALFGVIAAAVARSDLSGPAPAAAAPPADTPASAGAAIGPELMTTHLLAFEVLSLLLLAAIIGAIVIARHRDHGGRAP